MSSLRSNLGTGKVFTRTITKDDYPTVVRKTTSSGATSAVLNKASQYSSFQSSKGKEALPQRLITASVMKENDNKAREMVSRGPGSYNGYMVKNDPRVFQMLKGQVVLCHLIPDSAFRGGGTNRTTVVATAHAGGLPKDQVWGRPGVVLTTKDLNDVTKNQLNTIIISGVITMQMSAPVDICVGDYLLVDREPALIGIGSPDGPRPAYSYAQMGENFQAFQVRPLTSSTCLTVQYGTLDKLRVFMGEQDKQLMLLQGIRTGPQALNDVLTEIINNFCNSQCQHISCESALRDWLMLKVSYMILQFAKIPGALTGISTTGNIYSDNTFWSRWVLCLVALRLRILSIFSNNFAKRYDHMNKSLPHDLQESKYTGTVPEWSVLSGNFENEINPTNLNNVSTPEERMGIVLKYEARFNLHFSMFNDVLRDAYLYELMSFILGIALSSQSKTGPYDACVGMRI